jgi:hypothetical protein
VDDGARGTDQSEHDQTCCSGDRGTQAVGSRVLTPDGDDRFWALITVAMAKMSARTPDANAEADHRRSDLHWGDGPL